MFQLASGALPFTGETMTQLMYKIANEPPADLLSLNPTLPDCFVAIVNRCLAKAKEDRFANGEELAAAIRACAVSFSELDVTL
jgi:serine/threonine-protein kinase